MTARSGKVGCDHDCASCYKVDKTNWFDRAEPTIEAETGLFGHWVTQGAFRCSVAIGMRQ